MGTFGGGGGFTPDNVTLETNSQGEGAIKPSAITSNNSSEADITYSTNTTLTADVYGKNVTINSGVTVTSDGFNFYCSGTFTNNGTIVTGNIANTGGQAGNESGNPVGGNITYGIYIQADTIDNAGTINASGQAGGNAQSNVAQGGGGGSGGGVVLLSYKTSLTQGTITITGGSGGTAGTVNNSNQNGGAGGSTLSSGGAGGIGSSATAPGAGATPSAPTITNTLINTWFTNGFVNYFTGAAGGGGGGVTLPGSAPTTTYTSSYGGSGGGGGYEVATGTNGAGATGGSGQSLSYQYSTAPIPITGFTYTVTQSSGLYNRISTFSYDSQTTSSTSPVSLATQTIKPQSSGLVIISVLCSVSNDTIGDGVTVALFNGATKLASGTITQEGLASNPYNILLPYEVSGLTKGTNYTFSVQANVVTGGNAKVDILEFTLSELY